MNAKTQDVGYPIEQSQKELKPSYRIPLAAIIELKEKNLSQTQIAKLLGCHPSNISQRLQDIEYTNKYISHRAKLLAHYQRLILQSISSTDVKKASLYHKVISMGILYDKERLEAGLSTSNIAYADMIKAKSDIRARRQEIDNEIKVLQQGISQSSAGP